MFCGQGVENGSLSLYNRVIEQMPCPAFETYCLPVTSIAVYVEAIG
jgi:hypothetical protein